MDESIRRHRPNEEMPQKQKLEKTLDQAERERETVEEDLKQHETGHQRPRRGRE